MRDQQPARRCYGSGARTRCRGCASRGAAACGLKPRPSSRPGPTALNCGTGGVHSGTGGVHSGGTHPAYKHRHRSVKRHSESRCGIPRNFSDRSLRQHACSVCCLSSGFTISTGPLQEMLLPWGQRQPPQISKGAEGRGFPCGQTLRPQHGCFPGFIAGAPGVS